MAVIKIEIPSCERIPEFPDPLEVVLPGGVTISQVISAIKSVPNSADMGINLMQQLQPAMAPLVPVFNIIDTVVAVFNCIKAIPDTIGPPPDPTALAQTIPDLAQKVSKLLKLVPQLSVPLMVKGLLDVLISTLVGVRTQILALQQQMISVTNAMDRAAELEDAGLAAIAACAQANVEQQARNIGQSLGALGKLIGLINLFMGMIGGPEVPDLSDLAGKPLDEVIEPLDAFVTTLENIRDAIPVP
jgi:hypothetical protein